MIEFYLPPYSGTDFHVWYLFRSGSRRSKFALTLHSVGCVRGFHEPLSSPAQVVAHPMPDLGNPDRTCSLAMPFDVVGKLVGEPGWCRSLPGRLLAALSGRAGLSEYSCRPAYGGRHRGLHIESSLLRSRLHQRMEKAEVARTCCSRTCRLAEESHHSIKGLTLNLGLLSLPGGSPDRSATRRPGTGLLGARQMIYPRRSQS